MEKKIYSNYELPEELRGDMYDDSDWMNWFVVRHNGEVILMEIDNMQIEDTMFFRDMKWIKPIVEMAYELGVSDAVRTASEKK